MYKNLHNLEIHLNKKNKLAIEFAKEFCNNKSEVNTTEFNIDQCLSFLFEKIQFEVYFTVNWKGWTILIDSIKSIENGFIYNEPIMLLHSNEAPCKYDTIDMLLNLLCKLYENSNEFKDMERKSFYGLP